MILHAGRFSELRRPGTPDETDTFTVTQLAPGVFDVEGGGLVNRYSGVRSILFDGGQEHDSLILTSASGPNGVDVPLVAYGGPGQDFIIGGAKDDEIYGGAQNDTIAGAGGNDIIYGGSGHDVIEGNNGDDEINGGPNDDTIYGDTPRKDGFSDPDAPISILNHGSVGVPGVDTGVDTIEGNGGADTIRGGGGKDVIKGGSGSDFIYGQDDNDTLDGGSGNDWIEGGNGTDTRPMGDKGSFADILYGDTGNDLLIGGTASDQLFGGWGNDVVLSHEVKDVRTDSHDYVEGGPNNDFICGTNGVNEIYGGTSDVGYPRVMSDATSYAPPGATGLDRIVPVTSGGYRPPPTCDEEPTYVAPDPVRIFGQKFSDIDADGKRDVESEPFEDDNANGVFDPGEPFTDLDGDGNRDLFEPGLNDWTIELRDATGDLVATTTTSDMDLNEDGTIDPITEVGLYQFVELEPDLYSISEESRNNFRQTVPNADSPNSSPIAGSELSYKYVFSLDGVDIKQVAADFGNQPLSGIHGLKWDDVDSDGVRHPEEPGVAKTTIVLNGPFAEGFCDGSRVVPEFRRRTQTMQDDPRTEEENEGGQYWFENLLPGTYVVREEFSNEQLENGYRQTFPGSIFVYSSTFEGHAIGWSQDRRAAGHPNLADAFLGPFESESVAFTLADLPDHDVISVEFDLLVIGDWDGNNGPDRWFFGASDGNGEPFFDTTFSNISTQDGPSPPAQSYPDRTGEGENVAGTGATSINRLGYDLGDTIYRVSCTLAHSDDTLRLDFGGELTKEVPFAQEEWGIDNVTIAAVDESHLVQLKAGEVVTGVNFGNVLRGDMNGDGIIDLADQQSFVDILLNPNRTFVESNRCDLNGDGDCNNQDIIEFRKLMDTRNEPARAETATQTRDESEASQELSINAAPLNAMGQVPADISGTKWHDLNVNGLRDFNEPGISGVRIFADLNNNSVFDKDEPSAITDRHGNYSLDELDRPGNYIIRELLPPGHVQTKPGIRLLQMNDSGLIRDFFPIRDFRNDWFIGSRPIGISVSPRDGLLHAVLPDGRILAADLASHATQVVGQFSTPFEEGDIDFDPTNGSLYAIDGDSGTLYSYNFDDGMTIQIGTIRNPVDPSAMAFDSSGTLFILNTLDSAPEGSSQSAMLVVDKASGEVLDMTLLVDSLTGESIHIAGDLAGMDFHPVTGELHVANGYSNRSNDTSVFSVNVNDGRSTRTHLLHRFSDPDFAGMEFYRTDFYSIDLPMDVEGERIYFEGIDFANYEPIPLPDGQDIIFAAAADDVKVYGDNLCQSECKDPRVQSWGATDTIHGQEGSDHLYGQDGNDIIWGDEGVDSLFGGDGIDEVKQETGKVDQTITNALVTGQGPDTLDSIERATLIGGPTGETLDASEFNPSEAYMFDLHLETVNAFQLAEGSIPESIRSEFEKRGVEIAPDSTLQKGPDDQRNRWFVIDGGTTYWFANGSGPLQMYGSAGPVTLIGEGGDDKLFGSPLDDVLIGGDGNDSLHGGDGLGNDHYVFHSKGNLQEKDTIFELRDGGSDTLDLSALPSDEVVMIDLTNGIGCQWRSRDAQTDPDKPQGMCPSDPDTILRNFEFPEGAEYIEIVIGGAGADFIRGSTQTDNKLDGNSGNDHLEGIGGSNLLTGGFGRDELVGGKDSDQFIFHGDWGSDTVNDSGGEEDTLDFSNNNTNLTFTIDESLHVTDGDNTLTAHIPHDALAIEHLIGGSGHDRFLFVDDARLSSSGTIDGGPNRDVVDFSKYANAVCVRLGLASNDEAGASIATDEGKCNGNATVIVAKIHGVQDVVGSSLSDVIFGDEHNNNLIGGNGNDHIEGLAGDDNLNGESGDDTLVGGPDDDTYLFDPVLDGSQETDTIIENETEGYDTLDFRALSQADCLSIVADEHQYCLDIDLTESGRRQTHLGRFLVISKTGNIERVFGTTEDDAITASSTEFRLDLHGGQGDDVYRFNDSSGGTIRLWEDPATLTNSNEIIGLDELDFSEVTLHQVDIDLTKQRRQVWNGLVLELWANLANPLPSPINFENVKGSLAMGNTIIGSAADNVLVGGSGVDVIEGNRGRDIISASAGENTLKGGPGNDTYIFIEDESESVIFESGGIVEAGVASDGGIDTLDFSAFVSPIEVDLSLKQIETLDKIVVATPILIQSAEESLNVENVIGGQGGDTIIGNDLDNLLIGGDGSDTLEANGGSDHLVGGVGNDELSGNAGDDVVVFDIADVLPISGNDDRDVLQFDHSVNVDLREISHVSLFEELHLENNGVHLIADSAAISRISGLPNHVTIFGGARDVLTLHGTWTMSEGTQFNEYTSGDLVTVRIQKSVSVTVLDPAERDANDIAAAIAERENLALRGENEFAKRRKELPRAKDAIFGLGARKRQEVRLQAVIIDRIFCG